MALNIVQLLFAFQVGEEEPVLKAFKLMRTKGVGGIPVVDGSGRKAVGNISIRDIQFLLVAPELFKDHRCFFLFLSSFFQI